MKTNEIVSRIYKVNELIERNKFYYYKMKFDLESGRHPENESFYKHNLDIKQRAETRLREYVRKLAIDLITKI